MTDNIYAAEHPESDRKRDGGFTLWFTGLSGAGKTTIAEIVGPELEARGHLVEYLDGVRELFLSRFSRDELHTLGALWERL